MKWAKNFLNSLEDTGDLEMLRKKWFKNSSWLRGLQKKCASEDQSILPVLTARS